MDALTQQAFDQYNKDALVEWEYCGRTFLPDRFMCIKKSVPNILSSKRKNKYLYI